MMLLTVTPDTGLSQNAVLAWVQLNWAPVKAAHPNSNKGTISISRVEQRKRVNALSVSYETKIAVNELE